MSRFRSYLNDPSRFGDFMTQDRRLIELFAATLALFAVLRLALI